MITYKPTYNQSFDYFPDYKPPEIKGYRRQFSIETPRGEDTEIPTIDLLAEDPIKDSNEWSDIASVIKNNEGYLDTAKKLFNEPEYSVGYSFFNVLPDGTKITKDTKLTREQADQQLNIAIDNLSNKIKNSLNSYNLKLSPEQHNILIDLGYHAGSGIIDKLLKESNGDNTRIGELLRTYATRAKYGDTSITSALKARAARRAEGWNKYTLKAKNGTKLSNSEIISEAKKYIEKISKGEMELKDVPRKYYSYVEGELKGANPTSKALNDTGNKILDTADKVTMWVPGVIGSVNWLAHIGANAANKEYGKVAGDIAMASLLGAAGKWISKGIQNIGNSRKSKQLYSISNSNQNKTLSAEEIYKEWLLGKEDALKYLSSDTKKTTDKHNIELAKRKFGIDLKPFPWTERAKIEPKLEFGNSTNMEPNLGGDVKRPVISSPEQDVVRINLDHNINETAFHENLHRSYIGTSMSKRSADFYDWKTKKLLLSDPGDYMSDSEEAAVNLLEIGRKYNLLEAPYPGKIEARRKLKEIIDIDPNSKSKLGVTRWEDKPKRVWDALQGKYLGLSPILFIAKQNESKSTE